MTDWIPQKTQCRGSHCAANKHHSVIVLGARHFDRMMHSAIDNLPIRVNPSEWEQGFIDQWGRFYNREHAMDVVRWNGQPFDIERNGGYGDKLYSEGLY